MTNSLEVATRRLEQAVLRLEAALAVRAEAGEGGAEPESGEAAEMLARELAEARADYTALAEVTGTVSDRLDAAIRRLKSVLEA